MDYENEMQVRIATSAREHAFEFCLPLDPLAGVRSIARRLWDIAAQDEAVAQNFANIQKKLGSGRPIIGDPHTAIFERLKDGRVILDLPTAPEIFRPLFVAGYLRAKQALAQGGGRGIFRDVNKTLDRVEELVDKLEPAFVGEMLTEVTNAAKNNPTFAK